MRARLVCVLALAMIAAASCADSDQGVTASRSEAVGVVEPTDPTAPTLPTPPTDPTVPTTSPDVPTDPTSPDPLEPPPDQSIPDAATPIISFGDGKVARDYDNYLNAAFQDITEWWAAEYPATYGDDFTPVSGIYALYPERTDPVPSCEGPVPYEEVQQNAFYTDCGDIIVYDDSELLPQLVADLGQAAVAVVAAHEYGHAIQARAGVFDLNLPTVDTEQQADCFAGAWAAHLAAGESDQLSFNDNEIKGGLVAMITVGDQVGSSQADANAHGTAFDRVGAFQEGFLNGVARCADFIDNPNPRVDLEFSTEDDFNSGGNLPYAEILDALPIALDTMWVPTLDAAGVAFTPPTYAPYPTDGAYPSCSGVDSSVYKNNAVFCTDTNSVDYDDDFVQGLYNTFGDLAFGYPIISGYSDAVQVALGSTLTGEARVLLNDCLVGAFIIDMIPSGQFDENGFPIANNPNQVIVLSAGDLDEVVLTAVLEGDETSSTDVRGTAFDKIDAFRTGVLGGIDGCQSRIG